MRVKIKKYGNMRLIPRILDGIADGMDKIRSITLNENLADRLNRKSRLRKLVYRIEKFYNYRRFSVKIDNYDVWNLDHTLSVIIRDSLIKLRDVKQGAPYVDPEDVPEEIRQTEDDIERYKFEGEVDDNYFIRWDWVMDEMIHAFSSFDNEWEDEVYSRYNTVKEAIPELQEKENRIKNGLRLFGKYYMALWD